MRSLVCLSDGGDVAIRNGSASSEVVDLRVRETILRLRDLTRGAALAFAFEVGRVVVDSLYDGDLQIWRKREKKDHALRSLAACPDLPISVSALYRALAIYEMAKRTGVDVLQLEHLGVSHLRALLTVAPKVQRQLLEQAESQEWTVSRLEQEVASLRDGSRAKGGRKAIPKYLKAIRKIYQLTAPESWEGFEELPRLSTSEREELAAKLSQAKHRLQQLERLLPTTGPVSLSAHAAE